MFKDFLVTALWAGAGATVGAMTLGPTFQKWFVDPTDKPEEFLTKFKQRAAVALPAGVGAAAGLMVSKMVGGSLAAKIPNPGT